MNIKTIKSRLSLGENEQVEFIPTCRSLKTISKTVAAFLNTRGGVIVCGVDETDKIIGIENSEATALKLEQQLQELISPRSLIEISVRDIEKKTVIVVEIPAGNDLPYVCQNKFFFHETGKIIEADSATVRDILQRKAVEPIRWERRFSTADTANDVDLKELAVAVKSIEGSRGFRFTDTENIDAVLNDLSLGKYGRLTQGGDVLFGREPAKRMPQVRVRAACFSEDKASDEYRDMQTYEGPLFPVLEQVFDFIIRNTPTKVKFNGKRLEREDKPLYPVQAVREGLVNAFAHRDYSDFSGGIAVHVYPNRLEVWNSGPLPEGITPATLAHGHLSILRNPDIAHVLYLRGRMEKIGRGSLLILRLCQEAGLPEPKWESDANRGVTLTFFASGSGTKSGLGRDQVGTKLGPSLEQLELLRFFTGEHSIGELMAAVGRSNRTKFRELYLSPLLEKGYVEMTDPDRPTSSRQRYRLTEKGRACVG